MTNAIKTYNGAAAPQTATPTEAQVARLLSNQYRLAVAGTIEVLRFGAMFMGLGSLLRSQKALNGNNQHTPKEDTLRGWIEQNCPQINYNTAYKFYGLAKKMREGLAIPAKTDIYRLLTAPVHELTKKEAKIRVEMEDAVEGKSVYQLEIDWGIRRARAALPAGGARAGAGRPRNTAAREQLLIDSAFSKEVLGDLAEAVIEKRWHLRLDPERKSILCAIAETLINDLGA